MNQSRRGFALQNFKLGFSDILKWAVLLVLFVFGQTIAGVIWGAQISETVRANSRTIEMHQQFVERFTLVGAGVVEEHNHRAAQMPKQMSEEHAHLLLPDIAEPEMVVKAEVLSFRTDGDSRDGRDLVPPIAMAKDWSAAAGCPGFDDIRDQEESGFVGKHEVGAQPRSVFFTRGHSFCFQRSMASSSRSMARVSGF